MPQCRPWCVAQSFSNKKAILHTDFSYGRNNWATHFSLLLSPQGQLLSRKNVIVLFIMADLRFDSGSFWSLDGPKALNTWESDAFLASCSVPEPQKQLLLPEVNYWSSVHQMQTSRNDEDLKQCLCQIDDNLWLLKKHFWKLICKQKYKIVNS